MTDNNYSLPLGICKQAVMKLDSFMNDIREIIEDESLSPEHKLMFEQVVDMSGNMAAAIINIVSQEMNEEDFLAETLEMDPIENYPGDDMDIINKEI